jgi:hypothetical protein
MLKNRFLAAVLPGVCDSFKRSAATGVGGSGFGTLYLFAFLRTMPETDQIDIFGINSVTPFRSGLTH